MSQNFLGTKEDKNPGWFKQNRVQLTAGLFLLAMLLSVSLPVAVSARPQKGRRTNRNKQVTKAEVKESLANTSGVLESSDQVAVTQDSDSAASTQVNGTMVDVPKDAKQGVTFGAEAGPRLDIELPNANQAGEGSQIAPGIVGYEANNGSSNAVQATEDGGVRMLTIIDNPDAPTAYDYKITVPDGGSVQLAQNGGAVILDFNGQLLSVVNAPWAKDATGKGVETWFTTDGKQLTQHVKHNVAGVIYPISADPSFSWGWTGVNVHFSRGETGYIAVGGTAALAHLVGGTLAAGIGAAGGNWLADQAKARGLCLSVWKSHFYWWFVSYLRRC